MLKLVPGKTFQLNKVLASVQRLWLKSSSEKLSLLQVLKCQLRGSFLTKSRIFLQKLVEDLFPLVVGA